MVRIPSPLAWLPLVLTVAACESEPFQGELAPCPCDDGGCSAEACPIEILLDQTCVGEVSIAEALIGEHVERERITPAQTLTACSRIEPGAEVAITVRGGPWIWGPLEERCTTPGETRSLVLQCVESDGSGPRGGGPGGN
ncbi:MAG: hypothetical protein IT385_22535 [Deltaproteobacteria bacterium]|nr:hypothetical protein [Deltaproteobacteria bacterium]